MLDHRPLDLPCLRQNARRLETGEVDVEARIRGGLEGHVPAWNAYRVYDPEGAADRAQGLEQLRRAGGDVGPLAGGLLSVKDLYGVRGFRTHAGAAEPLPLAFSREGPLVRRLRRAGAIVSGKTRLVPLAFGALGTNQVTATPTNPSDPDRVPGGSSSGAAVSLREGTADVALGTDTAGSVRIPASFCDVVGFMPARGRWSTDGIVPLSWTLDSPGILARRVDDVAFVFELLESVSIPEVEAPDLRLATVEDPFSKIASPSVLDVFDAAIARLARAGARVRPRRSPEARAAIRLFDQGTVTATEADAFVRHRAPFLRRRLGPRVEAALQSGVEVPASTYIWRRRRLDALARRARVRDELRPEGEMWIAPTTPHVAPRLADVADDAGYQREDRRALHHTCVANTLGMCAISLPAGRDARGLPVGLMLMAPAGRERRLLAVARTVERAMG